MPNENEPIGKKSIVEQIMTRLLNDITSGRYKAGMKLPNEYELIEQLQVSRNSLREAMKILSAMGIVEIKRGDGTYVCSQINPSVFDHVVYSMISGLSSSDELLELRQILDDATVRMSIDKITLQEFQELQENVSNMEKAIKNLDLELAQEYDYQFHMMLITSCKNIFFSRIVKGVYKIFEHSIGENLRLETIDSKGAYYHQNILECIKNKDYSRVHEVVKQSLITWRERL